MNYNFFGSGTTDQAGRQKRKNAAFQNCSLYRLITSSLNRLIHYKPFKAFHSYSLKRLFTLNPLKAHTPKTFIGSSLLAAFRGSNFSLSLMRLIDYKPYQAQMKHITVIW